MPAFPYVCTDVDARVSLSASTTYYLSLSGCVNTNTTEAFAQARLRDGYTVDDGYVNILSNATTASSSANFRDDGANAGPSISITAATTGVFEDSTSASVATGSLANWAFSVGSGGTLRIGTLSCTLSSATSTALVANVEGSYSSDSEEVFYGAISGDLNPVATEDDIDLTIRYGASFSNLVFYISGNSNTSNSTYSLRDDGANALSVTITASTTGEFENTGSASVATGSKVNIQTANGASSMMTHSIVLKWLSIKSDALVKTSMASANSPDGIDAASTKFNAIEGTSEDVDDWSLTETDAEVTVRDNLIAQNMFLYVSANTVSGGDSTLTVRKNQADGNLTVTVSASTTGDFEDTSNTDSFSSGDEIDLEATTSSGSGSGLSISVLSIELVPASVVDTTNDIESYMMVMS